MSKSVYKRIVLKLSGEALQGKNTHGIDQPVLISIARQIKELRDMHVDVAIVLASHVGCILFWRVTSAVYCFGFLYRNGR